MTVQETIKQLTEAEKALKNCIGSSCQDAAGHYVSLLARARVETAIQKQKAYALCVTEMANGSSATKAQTIMKARDEYKIYLGYEGCCEGLLEMIRSMRAKGKDDDSERMMTK